MDALVYCLDRSRSARRNGSAVLVNETVSQYLENLIIGTPCAFELARKWFFLNSIREKGEERGGSETRQSPGWSIHRPAQAEIFRFIYETGSR